MRNHREYRTADKSKWGDGPWQNEPDKVQWIDEATGLDCLIVRSPLGNLCGYVGVAPGHPLHGKDYGDVDRYIDVHGGLTFADACAETIEDGRGICHIAEVGRPDHVWWFGFDCAHCGDVSPKMRADMEERHRCFIHSPDERYRDIGYVRSEVESLAKQLVQPALSAS